MNLLHKFVLIIKNSRNKYVILNESIDLSTSGFFSLSILLKLQSENHLS